MKITVFETIVNFGRMIRLSHTVFALPFALAAATFVFKNDLAEFEWLNILYVVLAFTGMRSFAMAYNRIADAELDAKNPRTFNREIPAGKLNKKTVILFAVLSFIFMAVFAYLLTPWALLCSIPAAFIVAGYSHAKRFTYLCHIWLGLAIGLAPPAVYLALTLSIPITSLILMAVLTTYIAGFDILYSLQDMYFDRANGLHSIPARFGENTALAVSAGLHFLTVSGLIVLWKIENLSFTYLIGAVVCALIVSEEHRVVGWGKSLRKDKIPVAFFNYNSAFSILFFVIILADWFFPLG